MMPFGLKNALHTYCRYVMTVFQSLLGKCVQTYMDDVAVYNNEFDAHLRHLEATSQVAVEGEMKIHPGKPQFCCTNVKFIGHRVSKGGISVMPEKVGKNLVWERPWLCQNL